MGSLMSMFNFISICPIVATIFFASLWSNLNLKFHQQKKKGIKQCFTMFICGVYGYPSSVLLYQLMCPMISIWYTCEQRLYPTHLLTDS